MDQRGSLQKSLAKKRPAVTDAMMEEFKSLVTEVLTPHASAILLDPEWGLPASKRRAKNAGLLLAYEKTGYDKTGPGRLRRFARSLVRAPPERSRRRLREDSALLHAVRSQGMNEKKHAWVERIGDECRANDIPFFLEFVGTRKAPTKRARLREEETTDRHREHERVQQRRVMAWTC